ncbi:response regulator transcription factor [Oceanobacillus sp. J11TS1]|uniref:response regulator transcription factor n=1 Tax=Oceanobacillus sp. J11TS1 TaxID=2807191 RepID=UPI001B1919E6|nr:response regulator transcription factor [Oceanobacillus sp. J11TS1]GIO23018.1 DNA-binding response regulator [Oceanobacillus sp. J11TS1]
MLKILIVDDHYLVGEGTKTMLESEGDISAKYVSTGKEALILNETFDIYIIDINMPDMTGIELSKDLLKKNKEQKIILYTGFAEQENLELFTEIGVSGIISKTATKSELIELIHKVLAGQTIIPLSIFREKNKKNDEKQNYGLAERDLIIIKAISEGLSNKDIAEKLFLSDRTIEYRLSKIYKSLGVKTRGEAIAAAMQLKILDI